MVVLGMLWLGVLVLLRPRPVTTDESFLSVLVAIFTSFYPFIYALLDTPVQSSNEQDLVFTIQFLAAALLLASIGSLGRNFSVIPQLRSISKSGPYQLIRHPIYTSYLLYDSTLCIPMSSTTFWLFWMIEVMLFFLRAKLEERHLLKNSVEYNSYCNRVKHMFVIGVF
jgi:protein-S-isoprenylcysteine O-methyltransferase Ste14